MSSLIILGVFVAFFAVFYLFKDKWIAKFEDPAFTAKYQAAEQKIKSDYDQLFSSYIADKDVFHFLTKIVDDPKISGVLVTKKQRSITSALGGAAAAAVSGVVKIEVDTAYYLILGAMGIYNIVFDTQSLKGEVLKFFPKSEIRTVNVGKGNLFDDLKQAQKLKLSGGGTSGDGADNSDLKKVKIELVDGETEEFFCYETIQSGKLALDMNRIAFKKSEMTDEEVLAMLMVTAIPRQTFEKLAHTFGGDVK